MAAQAAATSLAKRRHLSKYLCGNTTLRCWCTSNEHGVRLQSSRSIYLRFKNLMARSFGH